MTDLKDKTVNELLQEIVVYEQWDEKLEVHLRMEAANELARRLEDAQKQIVAQQAAMQKATVFLNLHHWKDNGTGRKYWDLDTAGEAHASLVNCYESLAAYDAETAAKALEELVTGFHDMEELNALWVRNKAAEYRAKAKGEKP